MRRVFLVAWALAAAAFFCSLDPLGRPLKADNQLYFFMAERAASGVPPHVSHVDSKNQLGVLVTAAAIAAGRAVGVDDVVASRVVSIAAAAGAVALAAELATLLAGSAAAGHVAALALLATRGFAEHAAAGNNVKIYMMAFLLLAHVAMAGGRGDKRLVAAGMAAGAAFLCWQPALLVVAAVAFEALVSRGGGLRAALVVAASAAAPVAAYELYFAVHGVLGEQVRQSYVMTLGSVHHPRRLWPSLLFVLTEGRGGARPLRVVPMLSVVFALAAAARLVAAPRRALAALAATPGGWSFVLAGAGATAFTLYDHQGIPDLFFPDPYFAVACGLLAVAAANAVSRLAGGGRGSGPAGAWAAAVAAALALALGLQMRGDADGRATGPYDLGDQRRLAEGLERDGRRLGSIWAYDAVHLLALVHLDNHVPYGLFWDDVRSVMDVERYRPLDDGWMPGIIVHSGDAPPGSAAYLGSEYVEATDPAFAAQALRVWHRRAGAGREGPRPGA